MPNGICMKCLGFWDWCKTILPLSCSIVTEMTEHQVLSESGQFAWNGTGGNCASKYISQTPYVEIFRF